MSLTAAQQIRRSAGHPIIDADGHVIEYTPAIEPYLRDAMGSRNYDRYRAQQTPLANILNADNARRRATRTPQSAWWGTPAKNTRDLATAAAPRLLYDRLDELGFDFAVLYPTKGFGIAGIADDELRVGVCRGFNDFYADAYGPFADRLAVAAVIPMHNPTEALDELERCHRLGFRVVGFPEGVTRRIPEPMPDNPSPFLMPGQTCWFDNFGLDSEYDYDPVWAKARELGYAVTFHGGLGHMPWQSFTSITNYNFNHIGSFATRMHMLVKSLFMGGVTRRFSDLNFAVLECGVGWAAILLNDIVEHWEKRNRRDLAALDPTNIDWDELSSLVAAHAPELVERGGVDPQRGVRELPGTGVPPDELDEWRHLDVDTEEQLIERFVPRFYFGCEADDRTTAFAFSPANHGGARLNAIFSSDLGHWDAGDMTRIVPNAWSLVEDRVLTEEDFADFVYRNPARLFLQQNPDFFRGTPLSSAVPSAPATPVRG